MSESDNTSTREQTHVVCGQCHGTVRVPTARLGDAPHCPQCKAVLFDGHPLTLTTADFDKHLQSEDLPLLVDVWAPWCGPCRAMAPHFETAAQQLSTSVRFAKINSDEEPTLAGRFGIRGIPALLLFRGGREIARQSGAMDLTGLKRWLSAALQNAG